MGTSRITSGTIDEPLGRAAETFAASSIACISRSGAGIDEVEGPGCVPGGWASLVLFRRHMEPLERRFPLCFLTISRLKRLYENPGSQQEREHVTVPALGKSWSGWFVR